MTPAVITGLIAVWMLGCAGLCVNERRLIGDSAPNAPRWFIAVTVLAWPVALPVLLAIDAIGKARK